MKRYHGLARFGWRATILFVLLVTPWSGADEAYVGLFRAAANAVFGSLAPEGQLLSAALGAGRVIPDSRLVIEHPVGVDELRSYVDVRRRAYVPSALVAALTLASPVAGRRRMRALLAGLGIMTAFALVRLGLLLAYLISQAETASGRSWGPLEDALQSLHSVRGLRVAWFAVPVAVWVLVTFEADEWTRFVSGSKDAAHTPSRRR